MKLPTVKLRHRRTGEVRKINATDYTRDIAKWFHWKIIRQDRGDATDEQVQDAAVESDLELFRRTNPKRQKWSGDAQRAFNSRSIIVSS